jgi:hypothetical protein
MALSELFSPWTPKEPRDKQETTDSESPIGLLRLHEMLLADMHSEESGDDAQSGASPSAADADPVEAECEMQET